MQVFSSITARLPSQNCLNQVYSHNVFPLGSVFSSLMESSYVNLKTIFHWIDHKLTTFYTVFSLLISLIFLKRREKKRNDNNIAT